MNKNIFIRKSQDYYFGCNRETGRWGLSKKDNFDLRSLEGEISNPNKFSGTSLVVLNITRKCNLDCLYCHVGSLKNKEKMSLDVGKIVIDKMLELSEDNRTVIFHGSEPLTNFDLIREIVDYSKNKGNFNFAVQTNGTLLTEDKIDYFAENSVGVGISLDGLKYHQDETRPYLGGSSSYHDVIVNLEKARQKIKNISVISVISKNNVYDLPEIADDFYKKGVYSVRFSPLHPSSDNQSIIPDEDIMIDKMKIVFDRYIENVLRNKFHIGITNFTDTLRNIFNDKVTYNCSKCSGTKYHPLIGVDFNGDIYPCDFFWGKEKYKIGNVVSDSLIEALNSPKNFRTNRTLNSLEECVSCDWKMFCGGGCPGGTSVAGKNISDKDSYCNFYKEVLRYVVDTIPILHKAGKLEEVLIG